MAFDSFSAFLQMGGYAFYVWASVGLTLLVLGWVMLAPVARHRRLQRNLARQQRRDERHPAGQQRAER